MTAHQSAKNVKWVEGLRGIASVMVVMTHVARAFDFPLFWPRDGPDVPPRFWQLPIIRIPAQGRIGVPIFAFLTGFVCALKPLKLGRDRHQQGDALVTVAKSAFRRPPRLVLPAAIATFISFCLTAIGGYETAHFCDSFWVRFDAPGMEPSFRQEVERLFRSLLTTWTSTDNPYDRHQWAMRPLLVGAFQVYILLVATMGMRMRYRMVIHLLLMAYWWLNRQAKTETFGSLISLGTLLADLSLHRPTQNLIASNHRVLSLVVAPLLLLSGLFLGSYPQEHEDWSRWSLGLHQTFVNMDPPPGISRGSLLVPEGTDARRRFSSIAIQCCALAIFISPFLRELLSNRYLLWLGRHSFAVYLVHGTILRTVGMWIAYGLTPRFEQREDGSFEEFLHVRSGARVWMAILVFVVLTYTAAWAWMRWVDTACARATQWLESKVFQAEDDEDADDAEKGFMGGPPADRHAKDHQRMADIAHAGPAAEANGGFPSAAGAQNQRRSLSQAAFMNLASPLRPGSMDNGARPP